ncbi:MAG: hypothetical protein WCT28_03265 [Patescibacteria group bacterium]|jgi:hypothetical protein
MKIKAVVPEDSTCLQDSVLRPRCFVDAFGSEAFARRVLLEVVGECFGAERVLDRPSEYYVQRPDEMVVIGNRQPLGVVVTISGVSRDGRRAKQFHAAMAKLCEIVKDTIEGALSVLDGAVDVQFFCLIQLDGQIELTPGSGTYGTQLEQTGWVKHTGT